MHPVFWNTVFDLASLPFIILVHTQEMGGYIDQEIKSREKQKRASNLFVYILSCIRLFAVSQL